MMIMMMMMEGNDDDDDVDALRLVGGKQERRNGELRFRKDSKDLDWCQVMMITDCLDNDDDDDDGDYVFSDHLPDYPNGLVNVNFGMHGCIHLGTQLSAQVLIMILIIIINEPNTDNDDSITIMMMMMMSVMM